MTDLNSLARTLAERLIDELFGGPQSAEEDELLESNFKVTEAVIREAIEKTLEEAARLMDERAADPYLDSHLAYTSGAEIIRERGRSLREWR